ncbi:DNA helicase MCM8 isoform X5 [Ahaetulla prasina]|uniref:DNA helicase MCM8 isoform X5 n=1 Tax=Ahaetulla prasina TaxID=499056 RepID=UPI0026491D11|nr:DNA helicase MCM8 isoform X5 [Ahaetulla prasina]
MSTEPSRKASGRGGGGFQRWRRGRWQGRGKGSGQKENWKNAGEKLAQPPHLIQTTLDQAIPYKGWKLYFSEAYDDNSPFVQKIVAFETFFKSRIEFYDKDEVERKGSILVDYKELIGDKELVESLPDVAVELRDTPQRILDCMGLAIHQVLIKDLEKHAAKLQEQEGLPIDEEPIINMPLIHARVYNYDPITQIKNIRANCYGKYVALRGTVVRVSNIKPICTKMAFICSTCGNTQSFPLPDGKYTLPTKCSLPECHGRSFTADRSSPYTVTVDWQSIKIQEHMSDDQREAGRIPRTIECELVHDLVDSCVPGDVITVAGIVKVSNTEEGASRNKNDKCVFLLYIEANSISNTKGQKIKNYEHGLNQQGCMEFSLKDLYAVQEIQAEENLFKLIVSYHLCLLLIHLKSSSLCPTIYGHEMVKAGLVLALFGGCQKYMDDKNRIPIRGDPHLLMVGDPGLGKSQMLQAVCNIAPRGVYVCGNATTTSGLTVTLSRDSSSGDFALEAGALVLGDQGVCGIDEFDKMGSQHQALLEAMEQQSISLAKAGIVCSLPARTSIIAAANPVGGHYNKAKTVSENLKMGSALLSRFDLVFILLDVPNEDHDHLLSEHVMAMRNRKQTGCSSATVTREHSQNSNVSVLEVLSDKPLAERLKARSRLELREKATKEDAEDVVEIMKYSMLGTYSDEFGKLDFERSQHGSGMSKRSQAKKFISALHRVAERTYNNIFELHQLRQVANELNMKYENPWTIPNLLSLARIGLAPILGYLIIEEDFNVALGVFALAGITDLLDGFIARKWANQKSALGSALDPLADKILISILYISLTCANLIPVPLTSMIILRDITLIAAVFYVRYKTLPPPKTLSRYFNPCYVTAQLKPTFISKVNTVVQLILVAASLAAPVFNYVDSMYLQTLWCITAFTTTASAYSYYHYGRKTVQVLNDK